jgi:lambda family phage minor tail protein L
MSNPSIPENNYTKELQKETQSLNVSSKIEILELDLTDLKFTNKISQNSQIADRYYFHNNKVYGNTIIKWGMENDPSGLGVIEVYPLPFELTGFEQQSEGLPRPTFKISNYKEYISFLLMNLKDLTGAKIIRYKTLAKFLNNRRVRYGDEIFFINKKNRENKREVEFELISSLELEGIELPRRQAIGDYCTWFYRCADCGYADKPVMDKNGKFFELSAAVNKVDDTYGFPDWPEDYFEYDKGEWSYSNSYNYREWVTITFKNKKIKFVCINEGGVPENTDIFDEVYWVSDTCLRRLSDCKKHFGEKSSLPFGGFPATSKYNYMYQENQE